MDRQQKMAVRGILYRIGQNQCVPDDASRLEQFIGQLERDIANLTAVLDDALVFEVGVTFPEEETGSE